MAQCRENMKTRNKIMSRFFAFSSRVFA